MPFSEKKTNLIIQVIGGVFYGFFLIGTIFPETWWAFHYPSFLPLALKYSFLIISGALIFFYSTISKHLKFRLPQLSNSQTKWLLYLGLPLLMGLLFWSFPIAMDLYGDANQFVDKHDIILDELPPDVKGNVASFNFLNSKLGAHTVFGVVGMGSYYFEAEMYTVFRWLDLILGMLFTIFWISLVRILIDDDWWQGILILLGLSAHLFQVFYGHVETYAFIYTALIGFLTAVIYSLKTKKPIYLFWMFFALLFCLKAHVTAWLLVPLSFCVLGYHFRQKIEGLGQLLSWKLLFWVLIVPGIIGGIFVYFFVTDSYSISRDFVSTKRDLLRVMFLPIEVEEPAPHNRYSLFHFNHLFDYINNLLSWSIPGMFLLALSIRFRKKLNWHDPTLVFLGILLLIFTLVYFVMNPLLGMLNDWDLFHIPAVVFIAFCVVLVKELELTKRHKPIIGVVTGLLILGASTFIVNGNTKSISDRFEATGRKEFRTFWMGSSSGLIAAVDIYGTNHEKKKRLQNIIDDLEPFAVPKNDREYANLLSKLGTYYIEFNNDYEKALSYFDRAEKYNPKLIINISRMIDAALKCRRYDIAHQHAWKMVSVGYPTKKVAYRQAIRSAVKAEDYKTAHLFLIDFVNFWPDDKMGQEIMIRSNQKDYISMQEMLAGMISIPSKKGHTRTREEKLIYLVNWLQPQAQKGNDLEYASVLHELGKYYSSANSREKAIRYFTEAAGYAPEMSSNNFELVIGHFYAKNFTEALKYVERLVKANHPNQRKALRMAIHISIEAKQITTALTYCKKYLQAYPGDTAIDYVHQRLLAGEVEGLAERFSN